MATWDVKKLGPKPPAQVNFRQARGAKFGDALVVAPVVPCASLYDNSGALPVAAQKALAKGAKAAEAQIAELKAKQDAAQKAALEKQQAKLAKRAASKAGG